MAKFTEQTLARVLAAIPHGKENAIHQNDLAQRLNMHPQALKQCIRELRHEHDNILSGSCGYWVSDNPEERAAYYREQRRQATTRFATIRCTGNSVKNHVEGQQELEFEQ